MIASILLLAAVTGHAVPCGSPEALARGGFYEVPVEGLRELAQGDDADAQSRIARREWLGDIAGVRRALEWARKASAAGCARMTLMLGIAYADGKGVVKDEEQGERLFAEALRQVQGDEDNPDNQYVLGMMHQGGYGVPLDLRKAADLYETAARLGHDGAAASLGQFHLYSLSGSAPDKEKGLHWVQRSARQANPIALGILSKYYFEGQGVSADYERALAYARRCDYYVVCQYYLGLQHMMGKGVPKDLDRAYKYLKEAAARESIDAFMVLGAIYEAGAGRKVELEAAYAWYLKAAEGGSEPAKMKLRETLWVKRIARKKAGKPMDGAMNSQTRRVTVGLLLALLLAAGVQFYNSRKGA